MVSLVGLWDRFRGICMYCDCKTWTRGKWDKKTARRLLGLNPGDPHHGRRLAFCQATREHVVRVIDGGQGGDNIKLSCLFCNTTRGSATPEVHRRRMLALVAIGLHPSHTMTGRTAARKALRGIVKAERVEAATGSL